MATAILLVVLLGSVLAAAALLAVHLQRVYEGRPGRALGWLRPVERAIYRALRVDPEHDMPWGQYARAVLAFSLVSTLFLYALQRVQGALPLNPADMHGVRPDLAFNTAVSFVTNTNWQSYSPELTMSYLTQMIGLAVQNFVSAAVGMAVAVALVRGFCRSESRGHRQLLGRPRARHALRARPDLARPRRRARRPRRRADVRRPGARADARRRRADDRARPVRRPGGDQGARHQRRRLVQRQLGAPLREPDAVHEPARDLERSC